MTTIAPLALPEVLLITPTRHGDARGWFAETWSVKMMGEAGLTEAFVQDNQAFNARAGTIRGLHFQRAPHAQGKLVRVLRGAIYDVAVDVRPGSGGRSCRTTRRSTPAPAPFAACTSSGPRTPRASSSGR